MDVRIDRTSLVNCLSPFYKDKVRLWRTLEKKYHPMVTWARKAHIQFSKSFVMTRLDFGQGVWKGDFYRQSALIPTCDALDSIVH